MTGIKKLKCDYTVDISYICIKGSFNSEDLHERMRCNPLKAYILFSLGNKMKKTVKNRVILRQMKEMVLGQTISDDKASDSDHSTDV